MPLYISNVKRSTCISDTCIYGMSLFEYYTSNIFQDVRNNLCPHNVVGESTLFINRLHIYRRKIDHYYFFMIQ